MAKEEIIFGVKMETGNSLKDVNQLNKSVEELDKSTKDLQNTTKTTADKNKQLEDRFKTLNKTIKDAPVNIRQMNKQIQEYQAIALEAGRTSPIGKAALKEAADIKDRYVDIQNEVNRLSNDGLKMQGALDLGTTVVGGFAAFQGAMALAGVESEDFQKTLVKLQGAQALLVGIETIRKNLEKESTLITVGKMAVDKAATVGTFLLAGAQGVLNAVMSANPIAIVVLAIAGMVAGFLALGGTIMDVVNSALAPFQFIIDLIIGSLQALGIMESETAKASREAAEVMKQAHVQAMKERREETERLIAAHQKMTDAFVSNIDHEINKRKAAGLSTTEIELEKLETLIFAAKEEQRLQKQRLLDLQNESKARANAFDIINGKLRENIEGQIDADEKINEAANKQVESERALEVFKIGLAKESSDKRKKINEDEAKAKFQTRKNLDDLELVQIRKTKEEKEIIEAEHVNALGLLTQMRIDQLKDEQRIKDAQALKDQEARDKKLAAQLDFLEKTKEWTEAVSNISKLATELQLKEAGDNEAKKEKIRKNAFKREKALNMSLAVINGAQAVLKGFATGGLAGGILAGITAVTQIGMIAASTYQGSGGGAGAGQSAGSLRPSSVNPQNNQANDTDQGQAIDESGSEDVGINKVVVVSHDITQTQSEDLKVKVATTF